MILKGCCSHRPPQPRVSTRNQKNIVDLKIDGVTQKVIDILGDETSVSKEISLFNLGR